MRILRAFPFLLGSLILIGLPVIPLSPVSASEEEWQTYFKKQQEEWQAHNHENFKEMMDLQASLKAMPQATRVQAILENHEKQYTEDKEFREKMHGKMMDKLKQELESDKKLSPDQKAEILNFQESKHQARVAYYEKRHAGDRGFYQNTLNDPKLTPEERKEAAKRYHDLQDKELEEYRAKKAAARKTFLERMRSLQAAKSETPKS